MGAGRLRDLSATTSPHACRRTARARRTGSSARAAAGPPFAAKWRAAFKKWDGAIAEEARKPPKDEAEDEPAEKPSPQPGATSRFAYRSYDWPEPASLPRREWLYGRHLIRGYLSLLVAPGATGKTALAIAETPRHGDRPRLPRAAVARRCGWPSGAARTRSQELERRFAAACLHYEVTKADVDDRFFVNSGHDDPLRLAIEKPRGLIIDTELRDAIVAAIRRERIDVAIFDPLITTHLVNENSNVSINAVADIFKEIAHDTGCAVYLLHHLRKPNGAQRRLHGGRCARRQGARRRRPLGAGAQRHDDRGGRQGRHSGDRAHPSFQGRRRQGRTWRRPPELAVWRRLESVDLGNGGFGLAGDNVQVAVAWRLPGLFDKVTEAHLCEVQRQMGDGEFAAATQTENWLGWLVGRVTGLETQSKGGRAHVRQVIEVWVKAGVIVEVEAWNAKSRRMQAVYRCGSRDRGGAQS